MHSQATRFEKFMATKTHYMDLKECEPAASQEYRGEGYVYMDSLVITVTSDGEYYLILGNEDYVREDIRVLEVLLYEYAIKDGRLD